MIIFNTELKPKNTCFYTKECKFHFDNFNFIYLLTLNSFLILTEF